MHFDQENSIIKICAEGMSFEGEGKTGEALRMFMQAWNEASNDFEKFISAHYVARHQESIAEKLEWDKIALNSALKVKSDEVKEVYPSLYLNIAKCYEDLEDLESAMKNYQSALSFADLLPENGYGNMIRSGINSGIDRVTSLIFTNKN